MKKLLSAYAGIMVLLLLVVLLGTSCARSGKKVYKPDAKPEVAQVQILRAMNLTDSTIIPLEVYPEHNVYNKGDKVWVWTQDSKHLAIVYPAADVHIPKDAIVFGYYQKYQLLASK